ncbi:hypothetical protein ACFU6I_15805 [Streptomyces sp. NPDC057486]|uniref:hypothetical protein n=1 Tax=Streptomyces sp. NPDC057486 TaxID=3346145 RepID=UPI0036C93BEC
MIVFAPFQHVVIEDILPVVRDERQVCVEAVGDVTTGADTGVWFAAWWHTPSAVGSSKPGWKGVGRMIRPPEAAR